MVEEKLAPITPFGPRFGPWSKASGLECTSHEAISALLLLDVVVKLSATSGNTLKRVATKQNVVTSMEMIATKATFVNLVEGRTI